MIRVQRKLRFVQLSCAPRVDWQISRQALYLHFPNRADLLSAVTLHIDASKNVDARLAASRAATSGEARLEAFIEAWGNYIPEIHGVAKALIAM